MLHLVGCLYYLYQWCTVKQISDNEVYLLIKYIKIVLWRVAKCLSYIEESWCLKVKERTAIVKLFSKIWRPATSWKARSTTMNLRLEEKTATHWIRSSSSLELNAKGVIRNFQFALISFTIIKPSLADWGTQIVQQVLVSYKHWVHYHIHKYPPLDDMNATHDIVIFCHDTSTLPCNLLIAFPNNTLLSGVRKVVCNLLISHNIHKCRLHHPNLFTKHTEPINCLLHDKWEHQLDATIKYIFHLKLVSTYILTLILQPTHFLYST